MTSRNTTSLLIIAAAGAALYYIFTAGKAASAESYAGLSRAKLASSSLRQAYISNAAKDQPWTNTRTDVPPKNIALDVSKPMFDYSPPRLDDHDVV